MGSGQFALDGVGSVSAGLRATRHIVSQVTKSRDDGFGADVAKAKRSNTGSVNDPATLGETQSLTGRGGVATASGHVVDIPDGAFRAGD
jgi:hypothetical protein